MRVRVPMRGGKRELLHTASLNAKESFARHKLRRASDHNARARALTMGSRVRWGAEFWPDPNGEITPPRSLVGT